MISRRNLLQTLAIGAGTVTFAPLLAPWRVGQVRAADSIPKRLFIFFHQNGYRNAAVDHVPKKGLNDFTLGAMSKPLSRHRDQLVVLHTLAQGGTGHNKGYNGILTGKPVGGSPRQGGGISLDRHLAKLVGSKTHPALPNLHLGMVPRTEGASFDENGTLVRPSPDPYATYEAIFKNFGADATLDPVAAARLKLRRSVLDSVATDLRAFRARLGAEDRVRADAQLECIRSLEKRLEGSDSGNANDACAAPVLSKGIPVGLDPAGMTTPAKVRAQLDLILSAFACDLTRIATFYLETQTDDAVRADFEPARAGATWHEVSHQQDGPGYDAFVRCQNWAFQQVAEFADRLKAIPEGDGTMLDNTLILVMSELGMAHDLNSYIWYSVGGKNLGVRGGRMLDLQGASHWRLLNSVMNMFGVPGDFGNAPGPLERYPA